MRRAREEQRRDLACRHDAEIGARSGDRGLGAVAGERGLSVALRSYALRLLLRSAPSPFECDLPIVAPGCG
jgi:hypothetical protein